MPELYPLPDDETGRLKALERYRILDTPSEKDFDDLVKLAAQICQTPISLVSLVDRNRQWFKGRYGLELSETPRRISFCTHTILRPHEMHEVPDATQDPRFAENELVLQGPKLRYYAGAPLVTPEGFALGTLCVLDTKPRRLSEPQKEALGILARQVMTQLELRRSLAELRKTSAELVEARAQDLREHAAGLERTVNERTAKLREMMAEMRQMSYSMVHEMRAPLRAIISFAQLLRERSGKRLEPDARDYLDRLGKSAARMDLLVTDALNYNKVLQENLPLEPVDCGHLLCDLITTTDEFQPPRSQVNLIGRFPEVMGNPGLLLQCFNHLLTNAVKYVPPGRQPQVEVKAQASNGKVRLCFADNGIGIPADIQPRIFDLFERGHLAGNEGTGAGLALVRKMVERMHGRIWVESEPGTGSRFWMELDVPPA